MQQGFGSVGAALGGSGKKLYSVSFGFNYAERKREYQHEMLKNETSQTYNLIEG